MAAANYTLKVNRDLLDPNFESYRLVLDRIPTYTVELDAAVEEVELKDGRYTLEHMQAFGMYNHLHLDPWCEDSVLFVDSRGRVLSLTVSLDSVLGKPTEVFSIGPCSGRHDDKLCASISLTSATRAALSDGGGQLMLLHTDKRGGGAYRRWEVLFSENMGEPFTIVHSTSHVQAGVDVVDVLLLRVQKDSQDSAGSGNSVSLEWVTVGGATAHGQDRKFEVRKRRVLQGKSVPRYAAVEPEGRGLMVASEKPFAFTQVDGRAVEQAEPMEVEKTDPLYFWQQTPADLSVCLRLPEGVAKQDVSFRVTADTLSVGVRGFPPLLEGQLYAAVDPEAHAWIIRNDKSLEVSLRKLSEGPLWPALVLGNRRGELVLSDEQAAVIHQRLTHLTSDDLNGNADADKPACNSQELEDCDGFPDDGFSLTHFDEESLRPARVVNLGGHQFLFTVDVDPSQMPCLCLRHDVDALVWQPRPDRAEDMWEHIGTFNALGYVQASKRDRKFTTCAPNLSYAALCECLRRVFIYRQPSPMETVLFNRKQGRQVGQDAKQQVASLDSDRTILGVRASNLRLFVLTSSSLLVLRVNSD